MVYRPRRSSPVNSRCRGRRQVRVGANATMHEPPKSLQGAYDRYHFLATSAAWSAPPQGAGALVLHAPFDPLALLQFQGAGQGRRKMDVPLGQRTKAPALPTVRTRMAMLRECLGKKSQQPRQEGKRQTVWNPAVASAQMDSHTQEDPIG